MRGEEEGQGCRCVRGYGERQEDVKGRFASVFVLIVVVVVVVKECEFGMGEVRLETAAEGE